MHPFVKFVLLVLILLIARPVSGSEDQWRMSPSPVETSLFQANVTPLINGSPLAPASAGHLAPTNDRPHTKGLLASTKWLKGAFSTETEVASNEGTYAADHSSTRMRRLGITGSTKLFHYGMRYRTTDQPPFDRSGREQREAWGEWNIGTMAIRSAVGQQRTRIQDEAAGKQSYNRIDVSWKKAAWPNVAFSYAQNVASHPTDSLSLFPQRPSPHTVEAAVGYGGAIWDARLSSRYGIETDLLNHGAESEVQTQTVTASLHPMYSLTITPTFGYRAERPEWSGARIDSPSASLSMNYKQSSRLSMTMMGNYFGLRSSDKLIDLDSIGGKGIVSWELEPLRDWKPQLSLEGGYNLQVNRLMPSAQTENFSGLLRLVLATM
jgi:hypothetical protein